MSSLVCRTVQFAYQRILTGVTAMEQEDGIEEEDEDIEDDPSQEKSPIVSSSTLYMTTKKSKSRHQPNQNNIQRLKPLEGDEGRSRPD